MLYPTTAELSVSMLLLHVLRRGSQIVAAFELDHERSIERMAQHIASTDVHT